MIPTARLAAVLTLLTLAGCMGAPTQPARFYVLSVVEGAPLGMSQPVSLGIGPVNLPDMLDRPQIVTRPDSNRVDLAEYHRWAGELDKNLARVLAQNLMQRLGSDRVLLYPWSGNSRPQLEANIDFFRFDGVPGQAAWLEGSWRLESARKGCTARLYRFVIEEPAPGGDYPALVSAMSRGVGRLSDDIARAVAAAGVCDR